MTTRKLTIVIDVKEEFLSDIIINASETAYSWFAFRYGERVWQGPKGETFKNNEGVDCMEAICISAPLRFDRPKDDEGTLKGRFTLDLDAVVEGLHRIVSGKVPCGMAGDIAAAVAQQDAGALDCNLCDLIVQAAVFNEIVYG